MDDPFRCATTMALTTGVTAADEIRRNVCLALDDRRQALSFEELHHNVDLAVGATSAVENSDRVGMVNGRCGLGFSLEAGDQK